MATPKKNVTKAAPKKAAKSVASSEEKTATKSGKSSLDGIPGITPKKRKALEEMGISTPMDLVQHLPRRYVDRTQVRQISAVHEGDDVLLDVKLGSVNLAYGKRDRLVVQARDATGSIELIWFGGARWIANRLQAGMRLLVFGNITRFRGLQMVHPEYEVLSDGDEAKGAIFPVYPLSQGLRDAKIDHRTLQQMALGAMAKLKVDEIIPDCLRGASATPRNERIIRIHKPQSVAQSQAYLLHEQASLWFPTLARLRRRKRDLIGRGRQFPPSVKLRQAVEQALPFSLHESQGQAVDLLEQRFSTGDQAHMLLQGDVGSGKTLVCLLGACAALEAGAQVAVLAPTEVLARQHLSTFRKLLSPLDIPVLYFASGVGREERASALSRLAHGRAAVAVGTHALFSDDVVFRDLAMVVFDEQHRFGVGQRQKLAAKGKHPHVVAASATPIPRSLLGAHGDMEVLEVRGRPGNRLPIRTRVVVPDKTPDMMAWLKQELSKGAKLFWVVPRVDESEEAASVEGSAERLRGILGEQHVGILHGRMDGPEQNAAIDALREGTHQAPWCAPPWWKWAWTCPMPISWWWSTPNSSGWRSCTSCGAAWVGAAAKVGAFCSPPTKTSSSGCAGSPRPKTGSRSPKSTWRSAARAIWKARAIGRRPGPFGPPQGALSGFWTAGARAWTRSWPANWPSAPRRRNVWKTGTPTTSWAKPSPVDALVHLT
jgi:ATP-dependent DNA helicase RecG